MTDEIHAVTGAFGFSGQYIAARLLERGLTVWTLTNSPGRANPFGGRIQVYPYNFDAPAKLVQSLEGVSVLYNNYWVRFNTRDFKHAIAVENSVTLFDAAKKAGVKRIVHVSITNPSQDSPFEYFRGKGELEKALEATGVPHSILRPAVLFGKEDILINNIAWMLRRFPLFGVFGDGNYRLQPIYVDDLAELAVEEGLESGNRVIDATGPDTFTYRELVRTIGRIIGRERAIVSVPDWFGYCVAKAVGGMVGDITITREEIGGLKADLLYTDSPPAGSTRLTRWAEENAATLGAHYANEMARRRNRSAAYDDL